MELNKRSVLVKRAVEEFERKLQRLSDFDTPYQEAAEIVRYTLSRVSEERRTDRFFDSMKLVLRALDKFPKPSIGTVKTQCLWIVDRLDDDATEFRAFNEKFR
jgi:hypothetical protein